MFPASFGFISCIHWVKSAESICCKVEVKLRRRLNNASVYHVQAAQSDLLLPGFLQVEASYWCRRRYQPQVIALWQAEMRRGFSSTLAKLLGAKRNTVVCQEKRSVPFFSLSFNVKVPPSSDKSAAVAVLYCFFFLLFWGLKFS